MIRRIRKDPDFAAEYPKAALEDAHEPRVLLIALRHVTRARGIARIRRLPASRGRVCIELCRLAVIQVYQRCTPLPKQSV